MGTGSSAGAESEAEEPGTGTAITRPTEDLLRLFSQRKDLSPWP